MLVQRRCSRFQNPERGRRPDGGRASQGSRFDGGGALQDLGVLAGHEGTNNLGLVHGGQTLAHHGADHGRDDPSRLRLVAAVRVGVLLHNLAARALQIIYLTHPITSWKNSICKIRNDIYVKSIFFNKSCFFFTILLYNYNYLVDLGRNLSLDYDLSMNLALLITSGKIIFLKKQALNH